MTFFVVLNEQDLLRFITTFITQLFGKKSQSIVCTIALSIDLKGYVRLEWT